jgi:hypothetical protein
VQKHSAFHFVAGLATYLAIHSIVASQGHSHPHATWIVAGALAVVAGIASAISSPGSHGGPAWCLLGCWAAVTLQHWFLDREQYNLWPLAIVIESAVFTPGILAAGYGVLVSRNIATRLRRTAPAVPTPREPYR